MFPPPLDSLAARAERMMEGADPAHDFGHVMRVCGNALAICRDERARGGTRDGAGTGPDERLVLAAALLHDVARRPKSDMAARAASAPESAGVAGGVLAGHGFAPAEIGAVSEAIRDHSFSRGATPRTLEGRVLQDADRLDALGAVGIARAFATGGALGRPLYSADDPFCADRVPDDGAWTVDHFFQKLLRLEDTMNTGYGREEARRRTAVLRGFLEQMGREVSPPAAAPRS